MKAKAVRLLMLLAVCTVALWPPAVSSADICPPGFGCAYWENVCQSNGGTFNLTYVGTCEREDSSLANLWYAQCTYSWREPWTLYCA